MKEKTDYERVVERYARRYPNKNPYDLSKGIYTLKRLKEYEEKTR